MTDDDKRQFVTLMTGLADYHRTPLSTAVLQIYWDGLKDFSIGSIEQAISVHIKTGVGDNLKFMPKVPELASLMVGTAKDAGALAWTKVRQAIQRVGTGSSVAFDDPIIHAVIDDMGGWIQMGHKQERELPFIAAEFERRYRAYAQRLERPSFPPRLIGYFEAQNGQAGFQADPPVLIGDPEAAMRVLAGAHPGDRLKITNAPQARAGA